MSRIRVVQGMSLCVVILAAIGAAAQQSNTSSVRSGSYDVTRESTLTGTVLSYVEASSTPPLGAHVAVQTASGVVDVHLGDARLLNNHHFSLAAGDSVQIVGENVAYGNGTQFFARVITKGGQSLVVRNTQGFPVRQRGQKPQGGVL